MQFKLSVVQKDGKPLRAHLEAAKAQGAVVPELETIATLNPLCHNWWAWWIELDSGRSAGLGSSPIGWGEIAAWASLTQRKLELYDVDAIKAIDRAYLQKRE